MDYSKKKWKRQGRKCCNVESQRIPHLVFLMFDDQILRNYIFKVTNKVTELIFINLFIVDKFLTHNDNYELSNIKWIYFIHCLYCMYCLYCIFPIQYHILLYPISYPSIYNIYNIYNMYILYILYVLYILYILYIYIYINIVYIV